jgi:hypothetical protein
MKTFEAIKDGANFLGEEMDITSIAARFCSALYRFAVSLTRSETDAADLVQETFLTLTRRSHQIRDFPQNQVVVVYDSPSGIPTNNPSQKNTLRSRTPA